MKRAILVPPSLGGALDELKHWLAITNTQDDASLEALLRASIETCEAFTGVMPLSATVEEVHMACHEWQTLSAAPVQAISGTHLVADDGNRSTLAIGDYEIDIASDGTGRFRLLTVGALKRVAVQFHAGIADGWDTLPDGLRHGILRLAAHHYRNRDAAEEASPPAAVAALWRPWRRMRLA